MLEKSIRCSAKRSAYSDRPSEASHSLTDGIALRVPLRECLGAAGPAPQRIARGQETAAVQDFDLAYVRFGSFSTDTPEAAGPFASAPQYRPQIHGIGACQPRRETTCSIARPTSRILRSVFCVPAIIRPTGAVPGSWHGTDRAQPSNRLTIAGLRDIRCKPPGGGFLELSVRVLTPIQAISEDSRPYSIFGQRFMTTFMPLASASAAALSFRIPSCIQITCGRGLSDKASSTIASAYLGERKMSTISTGLEMSLNRA